MSAAAHRQHPPRWTLAGFRLGAWSVLPLTPGVVAFGIAFGAVAAQKGFTLFDTFAMSASVCAGMAQLVVLEFLARRAHACRHCRRRR